MELQRLWASLRERWVVVIVAAGVVAAVAVLAVLVMHAKENDHDYVARVAIDGPLVEKEQYALDAQVTANEIASRVADEIEASNVALLSVREQVPNFPLADIHMVLTVSVMGGGSLIQVSVNDLGKFDGSLVLDAVVDELVDRAEALADVRFAGESPLRVDVRRIGRIEHDADIAWTPIAVGIALLALVAGLVAGILRATLDPKVRKPSDLDDVSAAGATLVDWDVADAPHQVREVLESQGAHQGAMLVVGLSAGESEVSTAVAQSILGGGERVALVRLDAQEAEPMGLTVGRILEEPDRALELVGNGEMLVVHAGLAHDEMARRLSSNAVATLLAALGPSVVVDSGGEGFGAVARAVARHSALVVVVVRMGQTSKSELRAAFNSASGTSSPIVVVAC